ncbi:CCA tRNA nucleotidyltransferase [Candidatus Woesearchaeota archaeon CG10_big_fil_rev_8_21_14_0_10_45_16]|nr:MAG: CCA tRNA nucleotidyltransferase [Candidatus Woesearchaeota archaeon CG10_big_fil_rev_8_21_14_0_10_45_16]
MPMKEVLQKIIPTKAERDGFRQTVDYCEKALARLLKDAKPQLGGSGAKDTWLSKNHDIDIFVLYDYQKYKDKSSKLSDLLEPIVKKAFPKMKIERLHGSRDYFQFQQDNYNVEIIPILDIKQSEEAINITDVSPLHARWVASRPAKVKDEIRLTKQFCKANTLYGAESYIGGFSGYVLEIMTINYGSFSKLLEASQKWRQQQVVDVEKLYPRKDALFHLNSSKTQSPLIVIDPVDKDRNAAAALTVEKFQLFRQKAREYLKKPSASFFESKELTTEIILKKAGKLPAVYLEVVPLSGKNDVVGSKLLKAFQFLQEGLSAFTVKEAGWSWNGKGIFYFILQKKELPKEEIRDGPPLRLKEYAADFRKKNKDVFEEDGRVKARVSIKHRKIPEALKYLLEQAYFKEKVQKVSRQELL